MSAEWDIVPLYLSNGMEGLLDVVPLYLSNGLEAGLLDIVPLCCHPSK